MEYVHTYEGVPPNTWSRPTSIVEAPVCDLSGLQPNGICPTYREIFVDGMQPHQVDTFWQRFEINSLNGFRATVNTPPDLIVQREFFVPPPEAMDWWRQNNRPLPPQEFDTTVPQLVSNVRITRPTNLSYVGGVVEVFGDINTRNLQSFRLSYGEGLNPVAWINLGDEQTEFDPNVPIGSWDTTGLDGLYSLRLEVERGNNSRETDAIQVTVDNIPPTISLDSVEPGKIYRWPADDEVQLEA